MDEFISQLSTIEKIYWLTAIISSVFFLIQIISVFVLGDFDSESSGDVDMDIDTDGGMPFQFFTFRNLVAFLTIFGWTGLGSIANENEVGTTILISSISGLLMMLIMSTLFYFISRMTDSGTMKTKNAIGKTGTVYIPVEAKRNNMGKVQVKIQSSLRELDAITDDEEDLKTGNVVYINDVLDGNILLISKSKK